MKRRSTRWKVLERSAAQALHGTRIVEPWFLFQERPDVVAVLPDGRRLVCDCKAYERFAHHSMMANIEEKYCRPGDVACLVTKAARQVGAYATVPLDFLAGLIEAVGGLDSTSHLPLDRLSPVARVRPRNVEIV